MISLQDIRARLATNPTTEATVVEALRVAALSVFEGQTGRLWVQRTGHVQVVQVPEFRMRANRVYLELYPITALALADWYENEKQAEAAVIDAADYDYDAAWGVVRRVSGAWKPWLKATITGGYTDATAPADVKAALVEQVVYTYHRFGGEKIAVESVSSKGGGATYIKGSLCPTFLAAVQHHKRRAGN